jgi:transcriptional/translational regulatory protein YebC/TACO1
LIDYGLEELEEVDGEVYVTGNYKSYGELQKGLEELGIEPKKSGLKRFANNPKKFSKEEMKDIDKLINKLEDDDDIQAVYTNIDYS